MLNIAVCGANGKMGQEVVKAVNSAEDMTLVAKIDILNGQFATVKDAKNSVKIDVLVDFTQPASIYENALYCLNNGINIVIGTTGLSDEQIAELKNKLTNIKDETEDEELKAFIEEYHLPNMDLRLQNLSGQSDTISGEYKFYSVANADINNTGGITVYNGGNEYIDACGLAGTIDGEYYTMNFQRAGNNSCLLLDRMDNICSVNDAGSECFEVKLNGNPCTYTQEEAQ